MAADVEKCADVGMLKRRDNACLALESLALRLAAGEIGVKHFDRNVPAQPGIPGTIHFAHSASPEESDDLIWAKTAPLPQGPAVRTRRRKKVSAQAGIRSEQRFHFCSERLVGLANLSEKCGTLFRRSLHGLMQNFFDLLPAF